MSAIWRLIARQRSGLSRVRFGRVAALLVCALLLVALTATIAGAVERGNLTKYVRQDMSVHALIEQGDTVEFGFVPDGLNGAPQAAGSRLLWEVVDVFHPMGNATFLTLRLDGVKHLGWRPAYREETCVPYGTDPFDKWLDSEIAAWLNSSQVANSADSIDYSLASGGIEGYGFLQTAFNTVIIDSVLFPLDDNLRVSLPFRDSYGLMHIPNTILRDPGMSSAYSLQKWLGVDPMVRDLNIGEEGIVRPIIKVYINPGNPANPTWFTPTFWRAPIALDAPTIYSQPRSASYRIGAVPVPMAKVGAGIESEDVGVPCTADHQLLYQWYLRPADGTSPVPVNAETGTPIGSANPLPDATALKAGSDLQPGRYVYFCEVTHADGVKAPVSITTVDIVISIRKQQTAQVSCSDCHTSDVRKLHKEVAGGQAGFCNLCHQQAPQGWSGNDSFEVDERVPAQSISSFANFNISCGTSVAACHSGGGGPDDGKQWHGESMWTVYKKHDIAGPSITIGTPVDGSPVTKLYSEVRFFSPDNPPRIANSCGGGIYSVGCHAPNSIESNFYFGGANLMATHNDYAKAQGSGGIAKVATTKLGSAGCKACHAKDARPSAIAGCESCHKSSAGVYEGMSPSCFKPAAFRINQAADGRADLNPVAKAQLGLPTEISLDIQQLVGDLLGTTPESDPLQAGIVEAPPSELGAGTFPLGSLLGGNSPLP